MQATTAYKIAKTISCHCWNKDHTQVAIATRNSNNILIYKPGMSSRFEDWKLLYTLSGHDLPVTAIDWDPNYNRILSCSEDCNAYVWNFENETWIPTLVVLKIKRAALCCKWSPNGKAFVVGSSDKKLRICTFNEEQDLWAKPLGARTKHDSKEDSKGSSTPSASDKTQGSIFCVCWDMTSQLVCYGSLDGSMTIVNAHYDNTEPIHDCPFDITGQTLLSSVFTDKCGIIESIAVNPRNDIIAYTDRNSDVHFLEFQCHRMNKTTVHCPVLPFTSLLFIRNDIVVAGSFDNNLHVLVRKTSGWEYVGVADSSAPAASGMSSSFQERIRMLQSNANASSVRTVNSRTTTASTVNGPHTNMVMGVQAKRWEGDVCVEVSSCGLDGRLVMWNMKTIIGKMNL